MRDFSKENLIDLTAWLAANSALLIGIVFYAGQAVNRIKVLEKRITDMEEHHEIYSTQQVLIASMSVKIDALKETLDDLRDDVNERWRPRP